MAAVPHLRQSCVRHASATAQPPAVHLAPSFAVHPEIGQVLYTAEEISVCCHRLGREIGADYQGKDVLAIGVVKGGFMFTADLVRQIHPLPRSLEVDFFKASSYGLSTSTSGQVKVDGGFDLNTVRDKHVLLVEDIVDTGLTMTRLLSVLSAAGALSVKVCTLLDKKERRKVPLEADYVGFTVPDLFVVGYGIDYAEKYRYLPYVGVPKDEFIAKH